MRKILIAFFVCCILTFNIFASEVEVKVSDNILTLDNAINMALELSPLLEKEKLSKESNFEVRDEVGGNIRFIPMAAEYYDGRNDFINIYKLYKSFDIAYDVSKKRVDIQKEKEIYDVIEKYKANVEARLSDKFNQKNYEYSQMLHRINLLKQNYGLIGEVEISTSSSIFEIARNTRNIAQVNLEKNNAILGAKINIVKLSDKQLKKEELYDISKKLTDSTLEGFLTRAISDSPLIDILERSIDIKQLELDYNTYNDPANYKPTEAKELDVRAEQKNVENVKDLLESIVREAFYGAQTAQKSYLNAVNKHEIDQNLHEVKVKQFELGMITKLELLESEKNLAEDELNIEKAKNAFDMAMILLEKPYIKIPI